MEANGGMESIISGMERTRQTIFDASFRVQPGPQRGDKPQSLALGCDLERLGYKIAVCPIETLLATGAAVRKLAHAFLTNGRVDQSVEMMSFADIKQTLGLDAFANAYQAPK